jgi:hypothetical protein
MAAKNLGISYQLMKKWIQDKDKVREQKKGSKRGDGGGERQRGYEHEMEVELMRVFTEARHVGRGVRARWFHANARQIYSKLYPERVIRNIGSNRLEYLGFKFLTSWF